MSNMIRQVLLVEDNPDEREFIRLALRETEIQHEITIVTDGQQALDFLLGQGDYEGRDTKILPALILLDLKLPRLNGLEVLKIVRETENTRQIPVVIFTSSDLQKDIVASYQLGANSIITKPIQTEMFMECVKLLGTYWLGWNHPPSKL